MNSLIYDSEAVIRLSVFGIVFVALAIAENVWPRRKPTMSRVQRWTANLSLSLLNTIAVRFLIPLAGINSALVMEESGTGLFNVLSLPLWLEFILYILIFDLTIYWQHRLYHAVPILWRLHRVHHTDTDYDLTTGNRFHPISILISALVKLLLVFLLGPMALAVLAAEMLLNITSMFGHSNLILPQKLDKALRYIVVTPDMHRIHHSTDHSEHSRNFGFNLSCWDRLFDSYLEQPKASHEQLSIGIDGFRPDETAQLYRLLIQPWKAV